VVRVLPGQRHRLQMVLVYSLKSENHQMTSAYRRTVEIAVDVGRRLRWWKGQRTQWWCWIWPFARNWRVGDLRDWGGWDQLWAQGSSERGHLLDLYKGIDAQHSATAFPRGPWQALFLSEFGIISVDFCFTFISFHLSLCPNPKPWNAGLSQ
jgi:hypothetical protein